MRPMGGLAELCACAKCRAGHRVPGDGETPLRQAQGRLSRQSAGPFGYAQGGLPALHGDKLVELRSTGQPTAAVPTRAVAGERSIARPA